MGLVCNLAKKKTLRTLARLCFSLRPRSPFFGGEVLANPRKKPRWSWFLDSVVDEKDTGDRNMGIYETVTEEIITRLEQGVAPWRSSWSTALPASLSTKKEYRGINLVILHGRGFRSRYWTTYREAQKRGGQVKKGAKGVKIVYWHWRTEEEKQKLISSGKASKPAPCTPFISTVFNLDQIEGLEVEEEEDVAVYKHDKLEAAEVVYRSMPNKPKLVHAVDVNPAYSPFSDEVKMPFIEQFENREFYYSTLFHELVHSTGHASRLGRFSDEPGSVFMSYSYSCEELVAELGSAFLSAKAGVSNELTIADSASYLSGWIEQLKNDKMLLFKASGLAQKAVQYIAPEPKGVSEVYLAA